MRGAGARLGVLALGSCLVAVSADARLVEVEKPWGRVWISVPEPAGNALPSPSSRSLAFRDAIAAVAARHAVDARLVEAIMACESAFDADAVSSAGAMGLMQLMPETAREMGVTDAFDVAQNLEGGTRHLAALLRSFAGDQRLAVAAYNAGEGAVRRAGGIPPYPETIHYVRKVEHYLGWLGDVPLEEAQEPPRAELSTIELPAAEPVAASPRRGKPVTIARDAQGRLVFVNKTAVTGTAVAKGSPR